MLTTCLTPASFAHWRSPAAHTFGEWMHSRFKELGLEFPTVTVAYRDLK